MWESRLTGILDELGVVAPDAATDLFSSGLLDSMTFVALLVQLEERFGLRFTADDLDVDRFRSVAVMARYLEERQCRRSAPRPA